MKSGERITPERRLAGWVVIVSGASRVCTMPGPSAATMMPAGSEATGVNARPWRDQFAKEDSRAVKAGLDAGGAV